MKEFLFSVINLIITVLIVKAVWYATLDDWILFVLAFIAFAICWGLYKMYQIFMNSEFVRKSRAVQEQRRKEKGL